MDIRQLDYFVVVVQRGNFTKAADDLFISRQALSKAVRNLEHEVGDALLVNHDNRLELTERGRMLYRDAFPLIQEFKTFEERYMRGRSQSPCHQALAVAMAHGTALSLPAHTIDVFQEDHPDILISIEEVTTDAAIDMVRGTESDISLVGSASHYVKDFDAILVVDTGLYVFVPGDNPLSRKSALTLPDLEGQPFVTFGKRNHLHRYFVEKCAAANVHPDILMTSSDKDLLVRSAGHRHALFFGFPPGVRQSTGHDHVLLPLNLDSGTDFGTYAIRKKDSAHPPSAEVFWDYLQRL